MYDHNLTRGGAHTAKALAQMPLSQLTDAARKYNGTPPMQKYRRIYDNAARRCVRELSVRALKLCTTCRGCRTEIINPRVRVVPCDWCGASGYDDRREERCWKCAGTRVLSGKYWNRIWCRTCSGMGVIAAEA